MGCTQLYIFVFQKYQVYGRPGEELLKARLKKVVYLLKTT